MRIEYAGLYPIRRALDSHGQRNSVRVWIANVGEGQVEYSLFAMAACALSAAGFVAMDIVIDGVMVWGRDVSETDEEMTKT